MTPVITHLFKIFIHSYTFFFMNMYNSAITTHTTAAGANDNMVENGANARTLFTSLSCGSMAEEVGFEPTSRPPAASS